MRAVATEKREGRRASRTRHSQSYGASETAEGLAEYAEDYDV